MMLREEAIREVVTDPTVAADIINSFGGVDDCYCWPGSHLPASPLPQLSANVRGNTDHYLIYRLFIEHYMEKPGDVLDIGAGGGHRSALLARYGNRVVGVECDPAKFSFALRYNSGPGLLYAFAQFGTSVVFGPSFDYAFSIQVIEHVPLELQGTHLAYCLASLKPGGLLFITTHNDPSPVQRAHPHIGLWEPSDKAALFEPYRANIMVDAYLDVPTGKQSDSPTPHYLMVIRK